jgi:anthranilate phosphoribosyltransferase
VHPLAEVLRQLGSRHVLVVHAYDGLDEISIGAPTMVAELKDGQVRDFQISPEQFDMQRADVAALSVQNAEQSLAVIQGVFSGEPGPARDIVALNAGAAIYVAGLADSLEAGVRKALQILDSGAARQKMDALVQLSRSMG